MVNQRVARSQRLAWLEGMRIFAVVVLLLYHAQLLFSDYAYTPKPTGLGDNLRQLTTATLSFPAHGGVLPLLCLLTWFGFQLIDVLVLMSGFSLVLSLQGRPLEIGDFLKHRLLRVLVPFWTVAWLGYPVLAAIAAATDSKLPDPWHIFAGATFPLLFSYSGDLLMATTASWWLMSLVISFTLLFPVLWHLLQRWGAANLLFVSIVVTVGYRLLAIYGLGGHPTYVLWESPAGWQPFALFLAKLSTFVLGMVVGHWYGQGRGPIYWQPQRALTVGGIAYLIGTICQFYQWGWVVSDLLLPIGLTLCCMVAFRIIAVHCWMEVQLRWLGGYSYYYFLIYGFVVDYTLQLVIQGDPLRYYLLLPVMVVGTFMLAVLADYTSPLLQRLVRGLWRDLDFVLSTTPRLQSRLWDPQVGDEVRYRGETGWVVLKVEKLLDEQEFFLCQVSDGQRSLWANEDDLEPAGKGF